MNKLLLIIAVCISNLLFSQSTAKMDFYLANKLFSYTQKRAEANLMLPMLVQGKITVIKQLVDANGGTFKYSYGNIAAIIIPVSALSAFNENRAVKRMEGAPPRNHILDDSANVKNHITEILNGQNPLPQAYKGKGVVMGFIDTGIDYLHADFKDSSGTRVKYYWDMNRYNNGYTPSQFGYGQSWTKAQIDATAGIDPNDSSSILDGGHGTNVAGAAVGNGGCNGHELGGAPKADIIMVAYNFSTQTAFELTDAANYIFTCADSLHEPCIINASLGGNDGSHDDSDLQGEMIDSMLAAKQPGRVFVAAAGNSGVPYHVHDSLKSGDTTFTWFVYDGGIGVADIPIFANQTDFNNVKFRIRCDKVQTGSYTERDTFTVFSSISNYMGMKSFNIYNTNGQRLAQVQSNGSVYGKGSYSLEFQILPDSTSYGWGFEATGTGRFDIWDFGSADGVVDTNGLLINPSLYPGIKKYKQPDTMQTICSSYQCSPHVITAQTYYDRHSYVDCSVNDTLKNTLTPGAFVHSTSRGPTRNYVHMKPDVSASGNYTLAAYPTWLTSCSTSTDSLGCHDIDGGTSMACPMVASAAALYVNKYPTATDSNVRRCLTQTAYNDIFTGPATQLPNYNWGYGKLDAFAALTQCSPGPAGVASIVSPNNFGLSVYPNPFSVNTTINYDFSTINSFEKASIVVYNVLGKSVKTVNLPNSQGSVIVNRTNLAAGMYFYSLIVDGIRLKSEKLEVL